MTNTTLNRLEGMIIAVAILWFIGVFINSYQDYKSVEYNKGYINGRTDAFSEVYYCYGFRGLDGRVVVDFYYPCEE